MERKEFMQAVRDLNSREMYDEVRERVEKRQISTFAVVDVVEQLGRHEAMTGFIGKLEPGGTVVDIVGDVGTFTGKEKGLIDSFVLFKSGKATLYLLY